MKLSKYCCPVFSNKLKSIFALSALLLIGSWQKIQAEEDTFVYAVQISAVPQVSPPQITLNWEPDPLGADSYTIYRKTRDATDWGNGTIVSGTTSNYTDSNVVQGGTYEYQIIKAGTIGYTGYGYIYTGINSPLTDNRGKIVLVVATNSTVGLDAELARLQSDLSGDGWTVLRHDVSSNDTPVNVKSLITTDYNADPANVSAVFLFGHVPILHSGNLNYDGHLTRPMPADAYYGDMDDDWPTDPATSPSFLPSDVELMVGRVDLANMPGAGAVIPWPSETELLRNYLNKDHNWRHKLIAVPRLALMGNRRGDEAGRAPAAGGYRNFEPFVGPGNIIEANTEDTAPPEQRWVSMLGTNSYLWAYGCGGGQPTAISELGTHDQYNDMWSTDVVGEDAKAVFVMLFGSWFGNWDDTDDVMRSFLATPTMGLAACMSGGPHWFLHHMGLGEPIGFDTRLTMNNTTLYRNQSNDFTRAIFIALMGDPTLRMDPVAPPSNLAAIQNGNSVNLTWSAASDTGLVGYHVYRSSSAAGPFSRLTGSPVTANNFTDISVSPGPYTYMVRSIKLQTTPSGSYYNPSEGVFASVTFISIPILRAARTGNGVLLSWNSQPGATYRVQFKTSTAQTTWSDLITSIMANGAITSVTDTNIYSDKERCYRVASP
jgi:hypothetical protein